MYIHYTLNNFFDNFIEKFFRRKNIFVGMCLLRKCKIFKIIVNFFSRRGKLDIISLILIIPRFNLSSNFQLLCIKKSDELFGLFCSK